MKSQKTMKKSLSNLIESYVNHISHINNIPNPEQVQYMNFTHSVAWTFSKEKKRKSNLI